YLLVHSFNFRVLSFQSSVHCRECSFQFLHLPVLFEKLVKQHCVHRVVAHSVGFSLFVTHDQIGVHSFHLFGHEPELRYASRINFLLVTEGNGFERKDRFARVVHRLDGFLETLRGGFGAESPVLILARARKPLAVLLSPLVFLTSAAKPLAVLKLPVVFKSSASSPLAVLPKPMLLCWSAKTPVAVLNSPVVLLRSALKPVAVLPPPVVLLKRAWKPLAVLSRPVVLL